VSGISFVVVTIIGGARQRIIKRHHQHMIEKKKRRGSNWTNLARGIKGYLALASSTVV